MPFRWGGWQAVLDQRERTRERDRRWDKLKQLADAGSVTEFWKRYAEYLEWDEIRSPSRKLLHKMVKATVVRLEA